MLKMLKKTHEEEKQRDLSSVLKNIQAKDKKHRNDSSLSPTTSALLDTFNVHVDTELNMKSRGSTYS